MHAIVMLLFALGAALSSSFTSDPLEKALDKLSKGPDAVNVGPSGLGDEGAKLVKEINASVDALLKRAAASHQEISSEYIETLEHDAKLIDAAIAEKKREVALAILRDVRDDVRVKEQYAKKRAALSTGMATTVKVRVRTYQEKKEVGSYLPKANPRRFEDAKEAKYLWSGPTVIDGMCVRDLPAGNFKLWVEDSSKKKWDLWTWRLGCRGKPNRPSPSK